MKQINKIEDSTDDKRPLVVPFYTQRKFSIPRLSLRDNKVLSAPVEGKKESRTHIEYTYKLEQLLSNGQVDIKTNFKMII